MSDAEDRWLAPILDMIDRATIALHLSESAHTVEERLDCLHQAHAAYYAARVSLNQLAAPQQKSEAWNYWHREAVQGEALTQTQLDE